MNYSSLSECYTVSNMSNFPVYLTIPIGYDSDTKIHKNSDISHDGFLNVLSSTDKHSFGIRNGLGHQEGPGYL